MQLLRVIYQSHLIQLQCFSSPAATVLGSLSFFHKHCLICRQCVRGLKQVFRFAFLRFFGFLFPVSLSSVVLVSGSWSAVHGLNELWNQEDVFQVFSGSPLDLVYTLHAVYNTIGAAVLKTNYCSTAWSSHWHRTRQRCSSQCGLWRDGSIELSWAQLLQLFIVASSVCLLRVSPARRVTPSYSEVGDYWDRQTDTGEIQLCSLCSAVVTVQWWCRDRDRP